MNGEGQFDVDGGVTCRRWRRAVIDKLSANPPDYLVFSHVDYKLVTLKGVTVPAYKRQSIWRDAATETAEVFAAISAAISRARGSS